MTKKLKIKFAKFESILVMQVLEQAGRFRTTEHVRIDTFPAFSCDDIYLRGCDSNYDLKIDSMPFANNAERDEYLEKVINWITEEQFSITSNELKVGSECEVRDCETAMWTKRKLITILPKQYLNRYVCEYKDDENLTHNWNYARPLTRHIEPKVDGDVYTWEI